MPSRREIHAIIRYLGLQEWRELKRTGDRRGPRARDCLLVELIAFAALRASEVAALNVGDLFLAHRGSTVRVRGSKARTVALPVNLALRLRDWTKDRGPRAALFHASTSRRRLARQEVWLIVKRAVRGAGVRESLNARSLRNYSA